MNMIEGILPMRISFDLDEVLLVDPRTFEKWLVHSRDFSRELTSLCSCFSENSLFFVPVCPLHVRRLTPASHVHAFTCRRS